MKYLAFDIGTHRTGVAAGESDVGVAHPRPGLQMNTTDPLGSLLELITNESPDRVVIGFPLHPSGSETQMSSLAQHYYKGLSEALGPEKVFLMDERYTTAIALQGARELGLTDRAVKEDIDSAAATLLLQSWFDRDTSSDSSLV